MMMRTSVTLKRNSLAEDGDNCARFIKGIGREHLLILWDLGDQEGVSQKFLNRLSSNVGVDCDNIHTDTALVQNPRRQSEEQHLDPNGESCNRPCFPI